MDGWDGRPISPAIKPDQIKPSSKQAARIQGAPITCATDDLNTIKTTSNNTTKGEGNENFYHE
jgi:hypothetical protein